MDRVALRRRGNALQVKRGTRGIFRGGGARGVVIYSGRIYSSAEAQRRAGRLQSAVGAAGWRHATGRLLVPAWGEGAELCVGGLVLPLSIGRLHALLGERKSEDCT